jgi:uncharacterized protein DUF5946
LEHTVAPCPREACGQTRPRHDEGRRGRSGLANTSAALRCDAHCAKRAFFEPAAGHRHWTERVPSIGPAPASPASSWRASGAGGRLTLEIRWLAVASDTSKERAVRVGSKTAAPIHCTSCGAADRDTCERLFELLLAKEYRHDLPFGPLHGVTVACFFLQHPEHPKAPRALATLLALLKDYIDHGSATLQHEAEREGPSPQGNAQCRRESPYRRQSLLHRVAGHTASRSQMSRSTERSLPRNTRDGLTPGPERLSRLGQEAATLGLQNDRPRDRCHPQPTE